MSETVLLIGRAVPVETNGRPVVEMMKELLADDGQTIIPGFYDSIIEWFTNEIGEDYFYHPAQNTIYRLYPKDIDLHDEIIIADKNNDGSYDYTLKFYNGGTGFDECLEEAINKSK